MERFKQWLLFVTNNDANPRDEQAFDIAFFIVNTIALVFGTILLIVYDEPQWIPFLIIEYTWAFDNMRHNRP